MRIKCAAFAVVALTCAVPVAQERHVPTFEQIIELKRPGTTAISPDGRYVAFTVNETNWDDNAYETEIFLVAATGGELPAHRSFSEGVQLTRAKKSSTSPAWSPDGNWIAFVSDRTDKRQIYLISLKGGEASPLTNVEDGVGSFAWAPDGKAIAFTMTDPKSDAHKDRDKKFGEFDVVDQDWRMTHLHVAEVDPRASAPAKARRLTSGSYTIGSFDWSPNSTSIAFDHRVDPNLPNGRTADISILTVANGSVRKLVTREGADTGPVWSPDGSQIAFSAAPDLSFKNSRIHVVPVSGGSSISLTDAFDEQPSIIDWAPNGILFSALEGISTRLYQIHADGRIEAQSPANGATVGGISFSRDFSKGAFVGASAKSFPEVYAGAPKGADTKLTNFSEQVRDWKVGTREMVSWKSTDGATIEGVLHKPADYQPGKRYPLLVIIHGGPTGISRPAHVMGAGPYPYEQWLGKGAVILEPNYRGSAGYGEKFRSLNFRNLGVGDAWDVLSGVDFLVAQGIADPDRMGVMGWSQGGYISAFLATHKRQPFKAISVGAGISDWMTYYVNTDIHQFTRHYLGATPWDDPQIYALTSPITTIKQARTPTLIQHGELDTRVPAPNAYELYQGLQDVGVPVKLIIYKGFNHGLNKPKAVRGAMEHNFEWFNQYVWGEKPSGTR